MTCRVELAFLNYDLYHKQTYKITLSTYECITVLYS